MNVSLYSITADPRQVVKSLGTATVVVATPMQPCSIFTPHIILNYNSSLKNVNYMYISDFGRYYYITDISVTPGGQIEITGSVDVLMSFATGIKNATATIVRSESIGAPTMIPDNKLPINPCKKELLTATRSFTTTTGNMYLVRVKDSPYTVQIQNNQ